MPGCTGSWRGQYLLPLIRTKLFHPSSHHPTTHLVRDLESREDHALTASATASSLDLEWALNGEGPPGIFSSSETPDERYGEYNCTILANVQFRS